MRRPLIRRKARIVPQVDRNGSTYWIVHPSDRAVREVKPKKKGKR